MYKRIIIALLVFTSVAACKKDFNQNVSEGSAQVKVSLNGAEFDVTELKPQKENKGSVSKAETRVEEFTQRKIIPFAEGITITAELTLDKNQKADLSNGSKVLSGSSKSKTSGSSKAAIERFPLDSGIKYKILAYLNGNFVDERSVVHGEEPTMSPFELDGGETYTFLAYSVNSTVNLPEVVGKQSLNTVQLVDVSEDLMWFKQDLQVVKGDNNLPIVLKHIFSQITVNISTGDFGGVVNAVDSPVLQTSRISASLKFSDGSVSYANSSTNKNVSFDSTAMNQATVSSKPVILITPSVTDGKLVIKELIINELNKPLIVEDLQILPGKKYNLNLTVNAPCTKIVYLEDFQLRDGETKTFYVPPTDYGFIFDVWYLDNSLNLTINEKPLLMREFWEEINDGTASNPKWRQNRNTNEGYDFQFVDKHDDVPPLVQNILFKSDSARWGIPGTSNLGNDVDFIYFLKGDQEHPIFRIHILPTGEIRLLGSRGNYGPLEEIEIFGNKRGPIVNNDNKNKIRYYYRAYLNPAVVWSSTEINKVVASQVNSGPTNMTGRGYGRAKINCAP